jgi:hypothetical protein
MFDHKFGALASVLSGNGNGNGNGNAADHGRAARRRHDNGRHSQPPPDDHDDDVMNDDVMNDDDEDDDVIHEDEGEVGLTSDDWALLDRMQQQQSNIKGRVGGGIRVDDISNNNSCSSGHNRKLVHVNSATKIPLAILSTTDEEGGSHDNPGGDGNAGT